MYPFSRIAPLESIGNHISPGFDILTNLQRLSESISFHYFSPNFELKEDGDNYLLFAKVVNMKPKDIVIEFSNDHCMSITGRSERSREERQPPQATTGEKASQVASTPCRRTNGKDKDMALHEHHPTYWMSERSVLEFSRSFSFPYPINQHNVKASVQDGTLSVVLSKLGA